MLANVRSGSLPNRQGFDGLLCNGCHEIILIGNGTEVHCDLVNGPAKALERLLDELEKPNGR